MGYDHQRIKGNAKMFYRNNTGNSIVSILIFLGISFGATMALYIVFLIGGLIVGIPYFAAMEEEINEASAFASASVGFSLLYCIFLLGCAAVSIALLPMTIGLFSWYRKSVYAKTALGEIFEPYRNGRFWGSVGTVALMQLYVFLWSMLFVIPGIIKSYSYSQTAFIKGENPNIPASRAIDLSKRMMDGHKGDLFYLHLSFIGWMLLSSLTYNILGIVYVYPYFYAALTFAYEEIKADAIARGVVDPSEFGGAYM